MKNELLNIKLSDKGTIKSTELVEIINSFRELEGKSELQHNDFMKKIRKESETLKSLGLSNEGNFSLIEYTDERNRKKPCYELDKNGMFMILNSESTLVRFKTVEYINKLEEQVQLLKEEIWRQLHNRLSSIIGKECLENSRTSIQEQILLPQEQCSH